VLTNRRDLHRDDGQLTLLVIAYALVAGVLVVVGIDASKVFLARRALAAAADAAALAGAEGVDTTAVYDGPGLTCGQRLPLSDTRAGRAAADSYVGAAPGLRSTFTSLDAPQVALPRVDTVAVRLSGTVTLPFARLAGLLDPDLDHGRMHLWEAATAQSPVAGAGC
jgi:uncharacterized membrane protein